MHQSIPNAVNELPTRETLDELPEVAGEPVDAGVVLDPGRGDLRQQPRRLRLLLLGGVRVPQSVGEDLDAAGLLQLHDALQHAAHRPQGPAKSNKLRIEGQLGQDFPYVAIRI